MIRKNMIYVLLLYCMLSAFGCASKPDSKENETKEETPVIGFTFDSLVIERWQLDRDIFVSTVESLGANVNVQNAGGDIDKQLKHMDYFIENKVDVIVIIATDTSALSKSIKKAKQAGIKIIAYDRLITNADVDLYITFDSFRVGELMAESLNQAIVAGGDAFLIFGSLTDSNVTYLEEGFYEKIDENRVNIVEKEYAKGWLAELAFEKMSAYLNNYNSVDAVVCGNDDLAGQAVKALSEKRLAGDVLVFGQDADLAACQRIVEGTQHATVFKDFKKLAKEAAGYAVKLANNETIDVKETIFDGTYEVPFCNVEPVIVTKENIDEVIIDTGFHSKEEVYLNLKE